jgi:hypothetical protein
MNRAIEKRLEGLFGEIDQAQLQAELREIRKDPKAHRLTRIAKPGKRFTYRYLRGGTDRQGRTVRFCWAVHPNAAGYWLAWKETIDENRNGERVAWTAHRQKKQARAFCERWAAEVRQAASDQAGR